MTSTTFFSGSAPSSVTAKRSAAASPLVAKAARAQAGAGRTTVAYPWMTQAMLAGMSPRARRLLRADY